MKLKSYDIHQCKCGKALRNLVLGMPKLGVIHAMDQNDAEKSLLRNEEPLHDVYQYRESAVYIKGSCQ